jgi:hypothetical protein
VADNDGKRKVPLPQPRGVREGEDDPTARGRVPQSMKELKPYVSKEESLKPQAGPTIPTYKMKSLGKILRGDQKDDEEEGLY